MRIAILSTIFFLSGASALIFQTLWLRLSGLAFGNSVWSTALILSSFMAGLALGNGIAANWKTRRGNPLRLYGWLELIIAAAGSTLVFSLPLLGQLLQPLFQALWGHETLLQAIRFVLSFLILLVPTTAMGLTLPVLLDERSLQNVTLHRAVGLLYGCNTLGAMVGVLTSDLWLVGNFGLPGTGLVAAAIDCTIAGAAFLLARSSEPLSVQSAAAALASAPKAGKIQAAWRPLIVCFGSGGIFLALEIVWFRFLRLYITSSTTAFALMLAVVLAGIGLGGLASGFLARRAVRPFDAAPVLLLLVAMTSLLTYVFFPVPHVPGTSVTYVESWPPMVLISLKLMFPVSFLSGMLFPAMVAQVDEQLQHRVKSAGIATLFNTLGAALGPLIAGFILLPRIGFQSSLVLCAASYGALAVVAAGAQGWSPRNSTGRLRLILAAGCIAALAFFPYRRDETHFANARRPYEADGSRVVAIIEGTADTLQLLRQDFLAQPHTYRLLTNGFSMSGTHPQSQRYMRLFAYLPLALRPEAEDALLICYGVGVTADALTREARLKRIDIVDIAREVFSLSAEYTAPAHTNPLRDPRVHPMVQDGRFFLQATAQHYDLITGEPPPLKMAGTVNLYTQEFFSLMRDRLKDGGIVTFWLPIYQLRVDEVKAILRAFQNVFPNASVWGGPDHEWIMIGINGAERAVAAKEVARLWEAPATRDDLMHIGVEAPEQLGGLFIMDAAEIARITAGVAPLTDAFPKRLGDARPDPVAIQHFAAPYMDAARAYRDFGSSAWINRIWPGPWKTAAEVAFAVRETRHSTMSSGGNWLAELELYLRNTRLRTPILDVLHSDEIRIATARAASRAAAAPAGLSDLVADALAQRDVPAAIRWLESGEQHSIATANDLFLLTYLYCVSGKIRQAEAFAATHAAALPKDWFAEWLWRKLKTDFGFRPPP